MLRRLLLVAAMLAGTAVAAVPPRISFQRTLPAPHNPQGFEDAAVVYAIGDNDRIDRFLEALVDLGNRTGTLRLYDGVTDAKRPRAELYLRVRSFTCRSGERKGEVSVYNPDGRRVKQTQRWATADCSANIEVLNARDGRSLSSFVVRGEGTSSRADRVTAEETGVALDEAAHYAARMAVEQIAPRNVRETVELDPEAPAFAEGMAMIEAGRFAEARRRWERAAKRAETSAPLQHNLAAVCEAMGDLNAAEQHFAEAQRLDPASFAHKSALEMFMRRNTKK